MKLPSPAQRPSFRTLTSVVALSALTLAGACQVDDEDDILRGDVGVEVVDQRGVPVPEARVYTVPTSRIQDVTDAFGIVSVIGAESKTYDLYAERDGALARTVLNVGPNQLAQAILRLPIILPGGGNEDGSPRLFVTSPDQTRSALAAEAVTFDATASDDVTPGPGITIAWTSNRDGLLGSGPADVNGRYVFDKLLSPGFHQLTVSATDGDGEVTERRWSVNVAE